MMKEEKQQAAQTDGIDPARVPFKTLYTGQHMPCIGMGTFGNDRFSPEQIAQAVKGGIAAGYRLIDCASVYGNEKEIGQALREVFASGLVRREDLFISSKVWNDMHAEGDTVRSCEQTLADLGLEYLDLYLVHWPFPNYHAPFCTIDSRNPDSKPFFIEDFMICWRQMEELVDRGLVRAIGTSNMTQPKMEQLLAQARIRPAVNEMELHPYFQQRELMDYMCGKGIQPIGFCPIGSPCRPDRDHAPTDRSELEDPVMQEIARRHHVHPATICVKWAAQNGQIPIPLSLTPKNYCANLRSVVEDPLTAEEMQQIRALDCNMRLVKGHVFLWQGAADWYNLWDQNGDIDRTGWER